MHTILNLFNQAMSQDIVAVPRGTLHSSYGVVYHFHSLFRKKKNPQFVPSLKFWGKCGYYFTMHPHADTFDPYQEPVDTLRDADQPYQERKDALQKVNVSDTVDPYQEPVDALRDADQPYQEPIDALQKVNV